jgi:cytosine deaminase
MRSLTFSLAVLGLVCVLAYPVRGDDDIRKIYKQFMREAIKEARKSLHEEVMPAGAVLVKEGKIIGRGHNRKMQNKPAIIHAETDCLEKAGKLIDEDYEKCVIYTTLSPCDICADAIVSYKIPIVVIGENETFKGAESYLKSRGVKLIDLDMEECKDMIEDFTKRRSKSSYED